MTATAVCFDLDDTLYPYDEYARAGLRAAADKLAAKTGHRVHNELADLYFEEGITAHIFDRLVARHDCLSDSVTHMLVEAYHEAPGTLQPYRDTTAVLESLQAQHRLGVLTDGRKAHEKLAKLGLSRYFEAVIATPELDTSKTDRKPFERLLSDISVTAGRTIYVGDDPRIDFTVPNSLGMGTVRLQRGRFTHLDPSTEAAEPDVTINRLEELPSLIDASRLE